MDTLCLSVKIVSHHLKHADPSLKEFEKLQISLHHGLIAFVQKELKTNGYFDVATTVIPLDSSGGDTSPHLYIFGILYLLQDLLINMDHSDLHNVMINNALKVARIATDSSVRSKAFELLACMSRKSDIGQTTSQLVEHCLEYEDWPIETREVAAIQWELMSVKALQMDQYLKRARNEARKLTNVSKVRCVLNGADYRTTTRRPHSLHRPL